MNIFTYGTLMIPAVMVAVAGRYFRSQKATLRDYARFTVKRESYPGIIPMADALTAGIVYFDVDEWSSARLDTFEGDLYQRTSVRVEAQGEEMLNAETYVTKPEYRGYLSFKVWDVKRFIQNDLEAFLSTYQGFPNNG